MMHPSSLSAAERAALFDSDWGRGLDAPLQAALLRHGRVIRLARRQPQLSRRMALPGALCGVVSGAVKLSRTMASGREMVFDFLAPGAWFGGCDGGEGSGAAYALEGRGDFVLFTVPAQDLEWLCDLHPTLPRALLRLRGQFVHRLTELLEAAHDLPLPTRLGRQIATLAERFGVPDDEGTRIALRVSQKDLAELTGASRQRVNAQLKAFERQGLLRNTCGYLEVPSEVAESQGCGVQALRRIDDSFGDVRARVQ